MNRWLFFAIAVSTLATAETPADPSPGTLYFQNGAITEGVYSNECFGLSLPIPVGWNLNDAVTADGKARRRTDKSLALLVLYKPGLELGEITLNAAVPADLSSSVQDLVSKTVHEKIEADKALKLIREASAVDYGGRQFYRSDYQGWMGDKVPEYFANVYTRFRGYLIGETIVSASLQGLDEAANSLQAISFQDDQINPKCRMALEESPGLAGVMSNVLRSSPTIPRIAPPDRVRVSSGISQGLLLKKVTPKYPDAARQAGIQGRVVLGAMIDKNGDIESLTLISGDPVLTDAALEAVRQWKYKPYLLQGQPVRVETQTLVNFTLSR